MTTLVTAPPTPTTGRRATPDAVLVLRRSLVAFVAACLSLGAIEAVVRHGPWLGRSIAVVALVMAIGAAGRAARLPRPLIIVVQLPAAFLAVIAFQASRDAHAGFLPGWNAVALFGHRWWDGIGDFGRFAPPGHASAGITTIIVSCAAAAAIAIDALAVSYGQPHLGGVILIAMYATPAATLPNVLRGAYFLLPTIGYLMLLLDGAGDRIRRWGDATVVEPGSGGSRLILRAGIVLLTLSFCIPAVLPSAFHGLLKDSGFGYHPPEPLKLQDPLAEMRKLLLRPDDIPMYSHRTDSAWPDEEYLRSATLDAFAGDEWKASNRAVEKFQQALPPPIGITNIPIAAVQSTLRAESDIQSDYLPMPQPATQVDVKGTWRVDPKTGDVISFDGRRQIANKSWTVTGIDRDPDPTQLSGYAPTNDPAFTRYLALPKLPPVILEQAEKITAGATSALEAGRKLQDWFRNPANATYDLSPGGSGTTAIVRFMQTKHGYAEQYAATMAVMARALGIPARLGVGFTAGHPDAGDPDGRTISAHNAHAWPELFLPDVGWTRFEPSPNGAFSGPKPLHWLLPPAKPQGATKQKKHQEQNQPIPPPPSPAESAGAPNPCSINPGACTHKLNPPPSGPPTGQILLIALLLALLAAPRATRTLITRRRWAALAWRAPTKTRTHAEAVVLARVAWTELRDVAVDLGHTWPATRTPRQAADILTREAALSPAAIAEIELLVETVERVRFSRPADHGLDHRRLRTAVLTVGPELAAAAGRGNRVYALVLPRSLRYTGRAGVVRAKQALRPQRLRPRRKVRPART